MYTSWYQDVRKLSFSESRITPLKKDILVMHELTELGTFGYDLLAAHIETHVKNIYEHIMIQLSWIHNDRGCFNVTVF